jgi:hypothetical protein
MDSMVKTSNLKGGIVNGIQRIIGNSEDIAGEQGVYETGIAGKGAQVSAGERILRESVSQDLAKYSDEQLRS